MSQQSLPITKSGNIVTVARQWFIQSFAEAEQSPSRTLYPPDRRLYERVKKITDELIQENKTDFYTYE